MKSNSRQDSLVFPDLRYLIEGHYYPTYILGGDRFCDWLPIVPPAIQLSTDYTFEMMKLSYEFGIRGFDLSCRFNLIDSFKKLKALHPEAIGIVNPNWLCGYKFNGVHLWEIKGRIILTIIEKFNRENNQANKDLAATLERKYFKNQFNRNSVRALSEKEIQEIYFDEEVWLSRLKLFGGLTDFCLVGANYADWMCALDRLDLLRQQIKPVRKNNMIPVSTSHWAGLTIPILDKEDFAAHWVYANWSEIYSNYESVEASIRKTTKPLTAFKILSSTPLPTGISATIQWLKNLGVKSFTLGLEKPEHVRSTLPEVSKALLRS